jgi:hypothetical protein
MRQLNPHFLVILKIRTQKAIVQKTTQPIHDQSVGPMPYKNIKIIDFPFPNVYRHKRVEFRLK